MVNWAVILPGWGSKIKPWLLFFLFLKKQNEQLSGSFKHWKALMCSFDSDLFLLPLWRFYWKKMQINVCMQMEGAQHREDAPMEVVNTVLFERSGGFGTRFSNRDGATLMSAQPWHLSRTVKQKGTQLQLDVVWFIDSCLRAVVRTDPISKRGGNSGEQSGVLYLRTCWSAGGFASGPGYEELLELARIQLFTLGNVFGI